MKRKGLVVFVNGYWNDGGKVGRFLRKFSRKTAEKVEEFIRVRSGEYGGERYWQEEFVVGMEGYFARKYFENNGEKVDFERVFVDGKGSWWTGGTGRYRSAMRYAKSTDFEDIRKKMEGKTVFFVSHSMGSAYCEGIVSMLRGVEIGEVMHFSAVDVKEFWVSRPEITYQCNVLPDSTIWLKNWHDIYKEMIFRRFGKEKKELGEYMINRQSFESILGHGCESG